MKKILEFTLQVIFGVIVMALIFTGMMMAHLKEMDLKLERNREYIEVQYGK